MQSNKDKKDGFRYYQDRGFFSRVTKTSKTLKKETIINLLNGELCIYNPLTKKLTKINGNN